MSDLISRQAAIDALRYAQHRFTVADEAGGMRTVKWSEDVIYFAAAERVLSELPSAQPERCEDCRNFNKARLLIPQTERKKGKWLRYGEDGDPNSEDTTYWQCSECLEMHRGRLVTPFRFCPNCGADMRGEQDE